jgi:uncharacterized protein (DUF2267 family)
MHRDDPLTQVRIHARLHGRNHTRRVVRAVLRALHDLVPGPEFQDLVRQLPADLADLATGSGDRPPAGSRREFVRRIADDLHIDQPDAAFYARVTFEQLNAFCRGTTPARLAAALPADLRPLLTARIDGAVDRHRHLARLLGSAATMLDLKAPVGTAPRRETVPASRLSS